METHANTRAWQFLKSCYLLLTIKTGTCTRTLRLPSDAGCEEDVANKQHTCSAVISRLHTLWTSCPRLGVPALLLQTAVPPPRFSVHFSTL